MSDDMEQKMQNQIEGSIRQKEFDENPNKELIIELLKHYHGMAVQARWPNEHDMERVIEICQAPLLDDINESM